jgi:hypothetical protein
MAAKKAFGGYVVSFKSVASVPVGDVFGTGDVTPSEMTKKLWAFVKAKRLSKKG